MDAFGEYKKMRNQWEKRQIELNAKQKSGIELNSDEENELKTNCPSLPVYEPCPTKTNKNLPQKSVELFDSETQN